MSAYNLFVSEPKFTKLFLPNRGWNVPVATSIRYSDICNESLKLSKIKKNFGRFCRPKFCWGGPHRCHTCPSASHMEKFREVIPTSP